MNKILATLLLATALATSSAFAADTHEEPDADLEAKLEAARERLQDAAHEVAELSAEVGKSVTDHFMMFNDGSRRSIIGVQLDPASGKDGARVKDVSPGGPAAEAGIQPDDVIVMVNGAEVKGDSAAREVARIVRRVEPESKVNVRVLRKGKPRDIIVVARPAFGMFNHPLPPLPPMAPGMDFDSDTPMAFVRQFRGGGFAEMELASLTPQLGRYFGTDEGVLVVRAPKEDSLKLEDGDVILSIDGRKPTSGSHATRILRSYQPGEKITMRVMRQKKSINLDVTLPERHRHPGTRVFKSGGEPT
jgi:S1-C subfamily serine protease